MKHTVRSLISTLLCLCICLSLAVPAFAANTKGITFSANLSKETYTASASAQTVTMDIVASAPVAVDGIGGTVTYDSALELTSVSSKTEGISVSLGEQDQFGWYAVGGENVENVTDLVSVTFTIPANTSAGTYSVGVTGLELTESYANIWENGADVTTTITIVEPVVAEGYTIALNTLNANPTHEAAFAVDVAITNSDDAETHFAAGQFEISYDNTALTLNGIASSQEGSNMKTTSVVSGSTTTIKVADYGADKALGNGIYTLNFTAAKAGNTELTVANAGFTTKENAVVSDLEAAASAAGLTVSIQKKTFTVKLPDYGFEAVGSTTVSDGDPFTFRISDPYYDYGDITVTMNGQSQVLTANGDGSYTIPAVTGNVAITTAKQEARSYTVTFEGETPESGAATATYMSDYSFTLPADKAADNTKGYSYSLKSITINGEEYTGYTTGDARTYTIPGANIKGNIVITIEKTESDPAYVFVSYTGNAAGSVVSRVETAEYGKSFTLTLDKISGYVYTVTATMGGKTVAVTDNGDSTYTIADVTGDLVINIDRTVNTGGVSVKHYLTLQNANMYLVQEDPTLGAVGEGYIPTYDGQPMYWSSRYNTYCYLVIAGSDGLSLETAQTKVDRAELSDTVKKVDIAYDMDVNETGKVDAADAQLVYNMYSQPEITEFTQDLTVLKFLEADVVGTATLVDTSDAVAIVNHILGIAAAQ